MSEALPQLSQAEKRLLRRTFQRHAAPYLLVFAGLAVWALSASRDRPETAPPVAAAPAPKPVDLSRDPAFLALKAEVEQALGRVSELGSRGKDEMNAATRQLAGIEKRMGAAAGRLGKLEKKVAEVGEQASRVGSAPAAGSQDPASWDVSAILERLYDLEKRQEGVEQRLARAQQEDAEDKTRILNRLHRIETETTPAAPEPQ